MMKTLKWLCVFCATAASIGGGIYYFFIAAQSTPTASPYLVEKPVKRDIHQTISALGRLQLKDRINIGSLVTGRVRAIHVEENDWVDRGALLVEIDTGLGDTEMREAEGVYEKALAQLNYQKQRHQRQKQLFQEKFISEAAWEESERDYHAALGEVKSLKAAWDKKALAYQNSRIVAPAAGIVLCIDIAEGEKVGADSEGGALLSLAPGMTCMEVELDVHEKDIGQLQKGQPVHMVVDTYPYKVFDGVIHGVGFVSKPSKEKECYYSAKAYIDNPNLLLRPGMSVQATVDVEFAHGVIALTPKAFLIKREHLQPIADILHYQVKPMSEAEKLSLESNTRASAHLGTNAQPERHIQFVWEVNEKEFREIPVEVGITDNIHFQIKSGLTGEEELVAEVLERDKMQELYEKLYRKI